MEDRDPSPVSAHSNEASPNYPVANNQLVSSTDWSQDSAQVGTTMTQAHLTLWTIPAYNLFDLYSVAPYLFGRN